MRQIGCMIALVFLASVALTIAAIWPELSGILRVLLFF